jgi:hypothetical protein
LLPRHISEACRVVDKIDRLQILDAEVQRLDGDWEGWRTVKRHRTNTG